MEVTKAIVKRVSIRKWKSDAVEKEKIEAVLEAGRRAPSWGNVRHRGAPNPRSAEKLVRP